jgi:hypothetical protein
MGIAIALEMDLLSRIVAKDGEPITVEEIASATNSDKLFTGSFFPFSIPSSHH